MVNRTIHLGKTPLTPVYAGPGDVLSGAVVWYGLQAYNAAYAAPGNNPAVDLHNDSTGTFVATINILNTGLLDVATATTVIAGGASRIGKIYDQSGNARHMANATNNQRPKLQLTTGPGSQPAMLYDGVSRVDRIKTSVNITQAVPYSYMAVASSTTGSDPGCILGGMTTALLYFGFRQPTSFMIATGGGEAATTTTANAFHCFQAICVSASVQTLKVDGNSNASGGLASSVGYTAEQIGMGMNGDTSARYDGLISEAGLWPGDSTASLAALNTNAHLASRWNF